MKKMALPCSLYYIDFRNLAEEHKIGEKEDLSKKVNLSMVYPPNNCEFIKLMITPTMICSDYMI